MIPRVATVLVAAGVVVVACSRSAEITTLDGRGSTLAAGGNQPGTVRQLAGVPADGCQAWELDAGTFGGSGWVLHLRLPAARATVLRKQLLRTAGVLSVKVGTNPRHRRAPVCSARRVLCHHNDVSDADIPRGTSVAFGGWLPETL